MSGDVVSNLAVNTDDLFVDIVNSRVGIGVTTPTAALDVVGNVAVDTNTLFVDSVNNKVGIGVTEPGATLEVTGNAYVSSNLEVGTANLFVDTVNSRVGIGVTLPVQSLHVSKVVAGGVNSILVSNPNGSVNSSAALKLGVSSEDDSVAKFGIIHERNSPYGGGETYFCTNYAADTTEVSESDMAMTILGSNKNVGIGTKIPGARLQVGDGLSPLANTRDADGSISVYGTGRKKVDQGKPGIYHRENVGLGIHSDYQMSFEVAGSSSLIEAMRILNDGKVGIGTDNPVGLLDIRAASKDPGAVPTVHIGDNEQDFGDYGMVNLVRHATAGGSKCHAAFIRNGNTVFGMGYYNNTNDFAFWKGFGNVSQSPAMIFQTTTGNVGINTTSPSSYTLYVNGNLFYGSGGLQGSDDRIKYNEENISNALTLISQLNPKKYEKIMEIPQSIEGTWIPVDEEWENVKEDYKHGDEFGFIAQDIKKIPELSFLVHGEETRTDTKTSTPEEYSNLTIEEQVTYTPSYVYESNTITQEEYSNLTPEEQETCTVSYTKQIETQTPLALNYQGLFVVAIGAIKELKAKNDTLETQLASVLARLDALESA